MNECEAAWSCGMFEVLCELPEGHTGRHFGEPYSDGNDRAEIHWGLSR